VKKDYITFEKRIARAAKVNALWSEGDSILIACSGGPDSLALLYTLAHLAKGETGHHNSHIGNFKIGVYCLDHQFRPEAATELAFVETQAKILNVPFYGEHINVKAYGAAHKLSEETAGREVRYHRLKEIALREGYTRVAVAHHKDDQAETILAHIIRGTGLTGLQGMDWKRPLYEPTNEALLIVPQLIRPFLGVTKAEIYEYLEFLNLAGVEDDSNNDDSYTRNKIRLHVIPTLKEINPNIVDSLSKLASVMATDNDYLMREARALKQQLQMPTHTADVFAVYDRKIARKAHEALLTRFWQLVFSEADPNGQALNASQYKQLWDVVQSREPKEFAFGKVKVIAQYDKIKIVIFLD